MTPEVRELRRLLELARVELAARDAARLDAANERAQVELDAAFQRAKAGAPVPLAPASEALMHTLVAKLRQQQPTEPGTVVPGRYQFNWPLSPVEIHHIERIVAEAQAAGFGVARVANGFTTVVVVSRPTPDKGAA